MPLKRLLAFQWSLYVAELVLHEVGLHYGENTGKSVFFVCLIFTVFYAVVVQWKMLDLFPIRQMYPKHKRVKPLFCKKNARSNLFYECWLAFLTKARPQRRVFSSEWCSMDEQWQSGIYYAHVDYNPSYSRLWFFLRVTPEV